MGELITAFGLGNSAILTNICLLPLYPGLIAFLASHAEIPDKSVRTWWLGTLVLLGVLSSMLIIGLVLFLLRQSVSSLLAVLLPLAYLLIILMGILTLFNKNPFVKMSTMNVPILKNRYATAFIYGAFLAPMTLPCIGPLVVSTFVLGFGSITSLVESLLFFFAFGLGFGWPLIALSILAQPIQRQFLEWITHHHRLINQIAGVLLIAIGVIGTIYEILPQYGLIVFSG